MPVVSALPFGRAGRRPPPTAPSVGPTAHGPPQSPTGLTRPEAVCPPSRLVTWFGLPRAAPGGLRLLALPLKPPENPGVTAGSPGGGWRQPRLGTLPSSRASLRATGRACRPRWWPGLGVGWAPVEPVLMKTVTATNPKLPRCQRLQLAAFSFTVTLGRNLNCVTVGLLIFIPRDPVPACGFSFSKPHFSAVRIPLCSTA